MRLLSTYYCVRMKVWIGRETQDFASLLGGYAFVGRTLLRGAIRHTGFHLSRYSQPYVLQKRNENCIAATLKRKELSVLS